VDLFNVRFRLIMSVLYPYIHTYIYTCMELIWYIHVHMYGVDICLLAVDLFNVRFRLIMSVLYPYIHTYIYTCMELIWYKHVHMYGAVICLLAVDLFNVRFSLNFQICHGIARKFPNLYMYQLYIYIWIHTYAYIYMYQLYIYIWIHTYAYIYVYIYTHTHIYMYSYVHVQTTVCISAWYIHAFIPYQRIHISISECNIQTISIISKYPRIYTNSRSRVSPYV
jgi:hypothetical protein